MVILRCDSHCMDIAFLALRFPDSRQHNDFTCFLHQLDGPVSLEAVQVAQERVLRDWLPELCCQITGFFFFDVPLSVRI